MHVLSANANLFRRPPSRLRNWLLPASVLVLVLVLAVFVWPRPDRFDPAARQYGHDWPGSFRSVITWAAVEIAIPYLVLRPWSYDRGWGRAALAWVLFLPWTLGHFAVLMHVRPTTAGHTFCLVLVEVSLFVTVLVGRSAQRRDRAIASPRLG